MSDVFSRPFIDFTTRQATEIELFSDASRNFSLGFGGYCGKSWMYAKWSEAVTELEPSIEYLELFAVTAVVLAWLGRFKNMRICLFCDNMSVVQMINNMSSSCKNCMILIRIITLEGLKQNTRIFA